MTLKEHMLETLLAYGLTLEESKIAVEYAIQALTRSPYSSKLDIKRKDGNYGILYESWETDISNYTTEVLNALENLVEHQAFYWCINALHSRS